MDGEFLQEPVHDIGTTLSCSSHTVVTLMIAHITPSILLVFSPTLDVTHLVCAIFHPMYLDCEVVR